MDTVSIKDYLPAVSIFMTLTLALSGAIWSVIRYFLLQDRKHIEEQQKILTAQVASLESDVHDLEGEVAVIQEQLKHLPDWQQVQERFDAFEARISGRLDGVLDELRKLTKELNSQFMGCPNHRGGK